MSQDIIAYINEIYEKYKTGRAAEHAHRPTFEKLIKALDKKLVVLNDPRRTEHGAPDFIFMRGDLIVGYAETKDVDADLDKVEKTEQVKRYLGYSNLILTNYLEFRFFRNGERYGEAIIIGKIRDGAIQIQEESVKFLENAIIDFLAAKPETIKSGARLAKIMGGKARRIRDNVKLFLSLEPEKNSELVRVYGTVKKLLVHDLTSDAFADMYAQTLVYGLFVARYHDETPDNFSRQEARDLVPASNPFLRHFFDHIVGPNFDKRLEYIVNELCEIFSHADVQELMKEYFKEDLWGKIHSGPDPVIHFYEDFLKEYDPDLRKKMGAYYTPLPVVQFIVRSVDYLLEKEFGLVDGLANTSKTTDGIHKVQILDPAVGTGTFISDVIRKIYERILKSKQEGRWPTYVHNDLLPRLHGFELMMTPYTIAHLKLGMAFRKTGFKHFNRRLSIYLTNSLESGSAQGDIFTNFGFAESIAEESKEASKIKDDKPIMVVVGNPPYSVSSSNKGEWIQNLIKVYKAGLREKKINLDDDYIKFLRFAEHFIEKNKTGVVAMITNNSFIDGITHRQMRKHLLETFDEIYILDLHGNSKKKEKAPDGRKDENVFDIQQGVSINIFVRKNESKTELGTVYHSEMFGKREYKFEMLNKSDIEKTKWQKLDYSEPYFFFIPKDFGENIEYEKGFKIDEVFLKNAMGIVTGIDKLSIFQTKNELEKTTQSILNSNDPYREFNIKDGRKYKKEERLTELREASVNEPTKISYRPFDTRYMYYTQKSECWINSPRLNIMSNFTKENLGFCTVRAGRNVNYHNYFVTKHITDKSIISSLDNANLFPLYLYNEDGTKSSNFKKEIVGEIEKVVGKVTPEDIFDYIYAVLHSPNYREKYKEFLKIDFPRVSYPKDTKSFRKLVTLGAELRSLHLLESPKVNKFITTYPVTGSDIIEKLVYKDGRVFINSEQYFGDVPEVAWNFYIGGYQPAQKWLKDRKGRTLNNADIEHYQRMIVALVETDRIMKEIDK